MNIFRGIIAFTHIAAISVFSVSQAADTIYANAKVWTVNETQPWAEAVAIKDGKFIAVGSNADVTGLATKDTRIVDLKGKMILPGFFDSHIHLENFYVSLVIADKLFSIPPATSTKEIAASIRKFAEKYPKLELIFGTNLTDELFPGSSPTRQFLDEIVPDRPVIIITASGHEALMNTKALKLVGITNDTPDPVNGIIVRDKSGVATGFLKEAAQGKYAMPHLPGVTLAQHVDGMKGLMPQLNATGLTSVKHIHGQEIEAKALKEVEKQGKLTLRVAIAWTYKSPLNPQTLEEQEAAIAGRMQWASDLIDPNYVKMNIDGIPTATAGMLEPYVGSKSRGLTFFDTNGLAEEIIRFDPEMSGLVFHTVGDRGARQVLDALEIAKKKLGRLRGRTQLAHGIFIDQADIPRLKKFDVTVEFSPIMWFEGGMNTIVWPMVGPERAAKQLPMRDVADAGGRVVIGSDGPIFMQTPLASIETAVTRLPPDGGAKSPSAGQALTLAEAIAARTINSAYLSNAEDKLGSIEVGKLADFVVLDRNLFEVSIEEVSETKVLMTVLGGKKVFTAGVQ
jgi:predicted amidohydrolase YtcJ